MDEGPRSFADRSHAGVEGIAISRQRIVRNALEDRESGDFGDDMRLEQAMARRRAGLVERRMMANLLRQSRLERIERELPHGRGMHGQRLRCIGLDEERGARRGRLQRGVARHGVPGKVELDRRGQFRPRPVVRGTTEPRSPVHGVHGNLVPGRSRRVVVLGLQRAQVTRSVDDPGWPTHDERDAQVRLEGIKRKVGWLHGESGVGREPCGESTTERSRAIRQVRGSFACHICRGDAARADPLGQRSDQRFDQLVVATRHEPVVGLRIGESQHRQRQLGFDAVVRGSGLVVVLQRNAQAVVLERVGVRARFLRSLGIGEQVTLRHAQADGAPLITQP